MSAILVTTMLTFVLAFDAPARRFGEQPSVQEGVSLGSRISGEATAGLWESLTIGWLSPMLAQGSKEILTQDHLYKLNKAESPEVNAYQAQQLWEQQIAQKDYPSLWAVTMSMHWKIFCLSGLLRACQLGLTFAPSLLLNQMIKFASSDEDRFNGYMYGTLLVAAMITNALVSAHSQMFMYKLGLRARSAFTTLVFKKALTMSQESRSKFSQVMCY